MEQISLNGGDAIFLQLIIRVKAGGVVRFGNEREESILSRCSRGRRKRVRKVARLDTLLPCFWTETTGYPACESEMGCGLVLRALRQLGERSHKITNLSDDHHASERGGEKKKGGRGGGASDSRSRQCGFAMHLLLCAIFSHVHENMM